MDLASDRQNAGAPGKDRGGDDAYYDYATIQERTFGDRE
jgi:hypothetical protein